jgi:hypothetical protein
MNTCVFISPVWYVCNGEEKGSSIYFWCSTKLLVLENSYPLKKENDIKQPKVLHVHISVICGLILLVFNTAGHCREVING